MQGTMTFNQTVRATRNGAQPTRTGIGVTCVVTLVLIVAATVGFSRQRSAVVGHTEDGPYSPLAVVHKKNASHEQNQSYKKLSHVGSHASNNASTNDPATIVCQLTGGMGNNLEIYAHCLALSNLLLRDYRLPSHIVLRHADGNAWQPVKADLKSCFPLFRSLDFEEGNTRLFQLREKEQSDLLGGNMTTLLDTMFFSWRGLRFLDPSDVDSALGQFANAYTAARNLTDGVSSSLSSAPGSNTDSVSISLPFLHVTWLASVDTFMDEMMQDLRNLFAFDTVNGSGCCALLPHEDETVFHLRNYLVELPKDTHKLGYDELGPEQAARDLVGHLIPGEKVAILSRYSQESAQHYIDAMERRGLRVRYISGQSGLQDFCFLMHSKKEMIGTAISTFFWWAAYLSNCSKVTAYSVDTDVRRSRFGDNYLRYNFTNPQLAERIFRPLISLDESIEQSDG